MKMTSPLRIFLPALILWAATASALHAQADFRIVSIHPFMSRESIKVGSVWRKDMPQRMQVSLQVLADTPSSAVFVKAYFYDKDDKLVASSSAPNSIWTSTARGTEEVSVPATFPHGKVTNVYFAPPDDPQGKQWKTILVVFGNDTKVAANSLPASELPKLDFPEKAKVVAAPQ